MSPKIDEYFELCKEGENTLLTNQKGVPITKDSKLQYFMRSTPPQWGGLARHLGFRSYQSLNDYLHRKKEGNETEEDTFSEDSFAFILTRAKSLIAEIQWAGAASGQWDWRAVERNLSANHGWIPPKQEVAVKGDVTIKVVDQFKDSDKPGK
jgi:hypothetical protein